MQEIIDFLTFKSFISHNMLIVFYYLGAIGVPFLVFFYTKKFYAYPKEVLQPIIPKNYRVKLIALFSALFLLAEILWRMMFEYLIAFLQIRDALIT